MIFPLLWDCQQPEKDLIDRNRFLIHQLLNAANSSLSHQELLILNVDLKGSVIKQGEQHYQQMRPIAAGDLC